MSPGSIRFVLPLGPNQSPFSSERSSRTSRAICRASPRFSSAVDSESPSVRLDLQQVNRHRGLSHLARSTTSSWPSVDGLIVANLAIKKWRIGRTDRGYGCRPR